MVTQMHDRDSLVGVNGAETETPVAPMPVLQADLAPRPAGEIEAKQLRQKRPRGLLTVGVWFLLPAALGGASLTMWKMRAEDPRLNPAQLIEERDRARKAETEAKKHLEQAVAARQVMEKERDQALAAEKTARRAEQNTKAVLIFLQDKLLLATGNPSSWDSEGLSKEVTLRKAVAAAEAKVASAFADRPLVEASIREILGAAHLDLDEAAQAVKQYKRALALREAELGPDDPATGDCRNQLAVAYRRAGRTDDASRLFDLYPQNNKKHDVKRGGGI